MNTWISTKDQLPELNKLVLTFTSRNEYQLDELTKYYGWKHTNDIVLFWMPFPDAPKDKK